MLATLAIRDFALIDRLELDFASGLNGLTGETGAGKSIVIDAITVLVGGRAAAEMIRTGAEASLIEGLFQFSPGGVPAPLVAALEALGVDEAAAMGELVLSRELFRSSRNRCRVNGRLVPVQALAALGECLVDLHGQHEHQSLLKVEKHRDLLDAFGGRDLAEECSQTRTLYGEYREILGKLRELSGSQEEKARRLDMLRYQLEEIGAARLFAGEEEELARERRLLQNAERLLEQAGQARLFLRGSTEDVPDDDGRMRAAAPFPASRPSHVKAGSGAVALLGEAASLVEELSRIDESMAQTAELLRNAEIQAQEAARAVAEALSRLQFDPGRLEEVEDRIDLIKRLERKYGPTVEAVLAYAARAERELSELESGELSLGRLTTRLSEVERRLADAGGYLSAKRKARAQALEEEVQRHLADLNMQAAVFRINVKAVPDENGVEVEGRRVRIGAAGVDQVEFLLSANPGEPPRPLTKVASGGELSRVMLALKTALSEIDEVPTLIFDEIDAGIGGRTAQAVAEKLYQVASRRQVILVTHLPQIACLADRHFVIEKSAEENHTRTRVQVVAGEERVAELARMLGGVEVTPTTLRHAREMVDLAEKEKVKKEAKMKVGPLPGPEAPRERRRA